MPAPRYSGNTSWVRTQGAKSGITREGLVYYEIPYAGKHTDAGAFRQEWTRGASCPVEEWSNLTLIIPPEIVEGAGGMDTATLRFEGPDISGTFGESEDTEEYYHERRELTVNPDTGSPGFKVKFVYFASVASIFYVQDTRRTTPKAAPDLGSQDEVKPLEVVSWESNGQLVKAYTLKTLLDDHANLAMWEHKTISGFARVSRRSDGAWEHEEFHSLELSHKIN